MTLTKADIVKAVTEENGFEKTQAFDAVETLLEIIKRTLESGEDVLVSGFGKFCVKEKKERKGRNPATSKSLILRSRRVVTFKCSKNLRDKVNKADVDSHMRFTRHPFTNL